MTEQERPRTEAGRELLRMGHTDVENILAIEAEGRQQAVREAKEQLLPIFDREHRHTDAYLFFQEEVAAILDRVAGLNASESPPTGHWDCRFPIPHDGPCEPRDASESPPTSLEAELSRIEATYPTWDERHPVGDASEYAPELPPLPTADELLRDLVQHWDAGDIDHDYDAITSAFDAARDHVRATIGLSGEHRHPVAPGQQRLHATMCFDGDCPQCVGDASESGQPPEASE